MPVLNAFYWWQGSPCRMLWHTLLHSRPALADVGRPSAAHQSSMGLRSPLAGPGPRREETQQSLFDWASTTAAPLLGGAPGGLVRSIRPISPVWDSARQRLVPEHPANQQSVGLTVDDLAVAIEVGAVAGAVKRLLQVVGLKQGQAKLLVETRTGTQTRMQWVARDGRVPPSCEPGWAAVVPPACKLASGNCSPSSQPMSPSWAAAPSRQLTCSRQPMWGQMAE